jgi:hypothetical protein
VIQTDAEYPQHIKLELHQDRVDIVDSFGLGDSLKVFVNIKGRKWTDNNGEDKYFNTIQAWKIEKIHVPPPKLAPAELPSPSTAFPHNTASASQQNEEEVDDLPF